MAHCRVLAVVGLHGNAFKPHTGTKTSVLFVQQWNDDSAAGPLCPQKDDYPIFFATTRDPSNDTSGDKIFVKHKDLQQWSKAAGNESANRVAEPIDCYDTALNALDDVVPDEHEHLVAKHDLFSHELKDGKRTPDGIAEASPQLVEASPQGFAVPRLSKRRHKLAESI